MTNSRTILTPALCLGLAACAATPKTESSGWSAARWMSQEAREINSGRWRVGAAPVAGGGFQLKLSFLTGQLFEGAAADEASRLEAFEAAAREAAPEGCVAASVELTPDGGAVANYACPEV